MYREPAAPKNSLRQQGGGRAELLKRWAQGEFSIPVNTAQNSPAGRSQLALSFEQEAHWRHAQAAPSDPGRNQYVLLRMDGILDRGRLAESLQLLVTRHAIFRSSYPTVDGGPVVAVADESPVHLEIVELQPGDPKCQLDETRRICQAHAEIPFSIGQCPLYRIVLFRGDDQLHWLMFEVDHMIFDGWSLGLVFRDLQAAYQGEDMGPWPAPFYEFAAEEKARTPQSIPEAVRARLGRILSAPDPTPRIPTDWPRDASVQATPGRREFLLCDETTQLLRTAAHRRGVTAHSLLMACFGLLIAKLSKSRSLLFYTVIANRGQPAFQGTIGLFRALVLLRVEVDQIDGFDEHLARVREELREAVRFASAYPASLQIDAAVNQFGADSAELLRVGLVLQNYPKHAFALRGLRTTIEDVHFGGGGQDIAFIITDLDPLSGYVKYNTQLFRHETIGTIIDAFNELIVRALGADNPSLTYLLELHPAQTDCGLRPVQK